MNVEVSSKYQLTIKATYSMDCIYPSTDIDHLYYSLDEHLERRQAAFMLASSCVSKVIYLYFIRSFIIPLCTSSIYVLILQPVSRQGDVTRIQII